MQNDFMLQVRPESGHAEFLLRHALICQTLTGTWALYTWHVPLPVSWREQLSNCIDGLAPVKLAVTVKKLFGAHQL